MLKVFWVIGKTLLVIIDYLTGIFVSELRPRKRVPETALRELATDVSENEDNLEGIINQF